MNKLIPAIEKSAFGVCQYLADKMGIRAEVVRVYFVYTSFLTFGSPLILYMFVAFWLNVKQYLRRSWVSVVR